MVLKKMFHLDVEDTILKLSLDEKYLLLSGMHSNKRCPRDSFTDIHLQARISGTRIQSHV